MAKKKTSAKTKKKTTTTQPKAKSEAKPKEKKVPKWGKSEAKELLKFDLVSRVLTEKMKPKEVYTMRPQYQLYKYVNFRTNLNNLRKSVEKDRARMFDDCAFYGHDNHVIKLIREAQAADHSSTPKTIP